VEAVLQGAREAGYNRAVLDTAGFMEQAQKLYESFGFADIPKYYENPVKGVRYMGADLVA
jgi:ribosomal protein S18 acetylase RimI-like enzyme